MQESQIALHLQGYGNLVSLQFLVHAEQDVVSVSVVS